jgi:hypothetical protein
VILANTIAHGASVFASLSRFEFPYRSCQFGHASVACSERSIQFRVGLLELANAVDESGNGVFEALSTTQQRGSE